MLISQGELIEDSMDTLLYTALTGGVFAVIGFVAPILVVIQLLLMRGMSTSIPFTTVQIVGGVVAALTTVSGFSVASRRMTKT